MAIAVSTTSVINDWQFFKVRRLGELGQPVLVHCENALIQMHWAKAKVKVATAHDYVASRPVFTEVEAIRRVLYGESCRLPSAHCHISSPEGVEE